jgi:hypothetical protein
MRYFFLSPIGTTESFFRPSWELHLHFITKPSVKTLGCWQICATAAKENLLLVISGIKAPRIGKER